MGIFFKGLIYLLAGLASLIIILIYWEDAWWEVKYWWDALTPSGSEVVADDALGYYSDKVMPVDTLADPFVRQTYIVTSSDAAPSLIGLHFAQSANQATGQPAAAELLFYGHQPLLFSGDADRGANDAFRSADLCYQLVANLSYAPADKAVPVRVFDHTVRVTKLFFLPGSRVGVLYVDRDGGSQNGLDCNDEQRFAIVDAHAGAVHFTDMTFVSSKFANLSSFSRDVIVAWSIANNALDYTLIDLRSGEVGPMTIDVPPPPPEVSAEPDLDTFVVTGVRIEREPIEVPIEVPLYNGPE